jgi:hypothetical protein
MTLMTRAPASHECLSESAAFLPGPGCGRDAVGPGHVSIARARTVASRFAHRSARTTSKAAGHEGRRHASPRWMLRRWAPLGKLRAKASLFLHG